MTRLFVLTLLVGSLSFAAGKRTPLTTVLTGDALAAYEGAKVDFKAQKFQAALQGFDRAWQLSKEPRLRWNSAACLRKLARNAEALAVLDAYLEEAQADLPPEDLDDAKRAQEALRLLVATVTVRTTPQEAVVSIDGTPVAGRRYLEPGRHAVVAEREGFQPAVRQETVKAGEQVQWAIELVPLATKTDEPAKTSPPVVVVKPPPPPVPLASPRPVWVPLAVAGLGAAAAAIGAGLVVSSGEDYERLRAACLTRCAPSQWAGARDREIAGVTLAVSGAAVATAGLAWGLWWLLTGAPPQVALAPGLQRLNLEVRF